MSLQPITHSTKGSRGIKKEINSNSIDIVFDILQVYAYSMPIESTVRELTSNAVDSQREKEIAIEILTGKSKEEDYFIVKHGKEFEDSKFKREYYNLDWLDTEHINVELEYREKAGSGFCDEFVVRDYGVGIGNGRMEGVLQLGYSTKRNTKEFMGSFGLGQKSPLSTMTPFYTMISAYNGQLYKLNIYSKKIDDLIGPFNLDTEEENKFITLTNGSKIYYEKTTLKNFTEIITPVKKLNKHKFINAVESQLLYLPNVRFYIVDEGGNKREHYFKASVLYNSDNLIISNNSHYSRPHLVVVKDKTSNVGICYNEINYKELELEQRYGQVGLKVQMRSVGKTESGEEYLINEGVTVTPNREQVIWNDDTKAYLLSITKNVANEAAEIINKELKEKDFLKWIEKANSALGYIQRGSTLYELAQMIDKSNIIPIFSEDKTIKFKNPGDMFWGMYPREVTYKNEYVKSTGGYVKKVDRSVVESWGHFAGNKVYLKLSDDKASNVKDQYILQTQLEDRRSFVILELEDLDKKLDELLEKTAETLKEEVTEKFEEKRAKMLRILELIKNSSECLDYDAVEVPEDFKVTAEEEERKVEEVIAKESASLEELRKANGEIVFFTPRVSSHSYATRYELIWDKVEEKTSTVLSWKSKVYFGFQEDSEMLQAACRTLGLQQISWYNKEIRIVKISKKNEKHFKSIGTHISNFFYQLNDSCITVDEDVKKYFTARFVAKQITENQSINFFKNYAQIDNRIAEIYDYLIEYSNKFTQTLKLRKLTDDDVESQLLQQLIKYGEFQLFVTDNSEDEKAIAEKSKELFGTELVKNASILDMTVVNQCNLLLEYSEPVKELFNEVSYFVPRRYDEAKTLTSQAERLIRVLLQEVGLDKFSIPDELTIKKTEEKVAETE